jgi:hypothetical protein
MEQASVLLSYIRTQVLGLIEIDCELDTEVLSCLSDCSECNSDKISTL